MVLVTSAQFDKLVDEIRENVLIQGCSVVIFLAPDPDALCAGKILEYMLKSQNISHIIVPVAGYDELSIEFERIVRGKKIASDGLDEDDDSDDEDEATGSLVNTVFLINCGGMVELVDFFNITEDETFSIFVLDSHRPIDLHNVYGPNQIKILDVGDIAKEVLPREDALSEDDDDDSEDEEDEEDDEDGLDGEDRERPRKRRKRGGFDVEKRERLILKQQRRAAYYQGTYYGNSAASVSYELVQKGLNSSSLTEMQWLTILGVTSQYIHEQIDKDRYMEEAAHIRGLIADDTIYDDESLKVTDTRMHIKAEYEYRFMLFRHWSLYDAMYHSQYVATQLGVWTNKGQEQLDRVLAVMGIAKSKCSQKYSSMHHSLKDQLKSQLDQRAGELKLPEIAFDSFMLKSSCRRPISASDAVHAILGLIDQNCTESNKNWTDCCMEAFDALSFKRTDLIEKGLNNAMQQQRAMVRQLTAVLSKRRDIVRPTGKFWVAYLNPSTDTDKEMFTHPTTLIKLLHFLQHALRSEIERKQNASQLQEGRRKKGVKPLVLVAPNEKAGTYLVVGLPKRNGFGEAHKNLLGHAFRMAAEKIKAKIKHDRFDTSIMEITKDDLSHFIVGLQAITI